MNTVQEREKKIRDWFEAWLSRDDFCIDTVFSENIIYRESYGPVYIGINQLHRWYKEWNTEGTVLKWEIHDILHNESTTAISWRFTCRMNSKNHDSSFDGMSLIRWDQNDRIVELTEYACK